ncbi:hypothetical protein PybrP1_004373 [[Pythium] brassicae (nom. inval.)]|nr:hypothetical protein PybrP1_004373 [[Pythium] brassicae (nom. inval.)]
MQEVRRRRRRGAVLVLRLLIAAALLSMTASLDLSSRQLTEITTSAGGSAFAFLSSGGSVADKTAAELALETELVLRDNALETVPAALFRALKSATRVDLSNNPLLTTLEPNSFVDLPELVEITCVNTSLAALPQLLASGCPKLAVMRFSASAIRSVQPTTFANLSALSTLDLSGNKLTTVPGELFSVAKSWDVLDFKQNSINGAPSLIQNAVVTGYISFEQNLFFEITEREFAQAAHIRELRLGHNGIDTVNSNAFEGMTALRKLDLSDNVISIIGADAFKGLDALQELLLGDNYLKRLRLESIPPKLERLELQSNLLDLLPDLSANGVVLKAPHLKTLNLSRNAIWALETNSELVPYPGLVQLDLGWNRIENFTACVLKPIQSTIELINLDFNRIESVPSTTFLELLNNSQITISLQSNPGIGTDPTAFSSLTCPNGSVFDMTTMHSRARPEVQLYGCIQCRTGSYHDVKAGQCIRCVGRAFADQDGATACQYCPYSSDLDDERQICLEFACNGFCWMTILLGLGIPLLLFGSKLLLYTISTSIAKQHKLNVAEQEQMTTWRMEQMMRQLGAAAPLHPAEPDDEYASHNHNATLGPCRIYDLPKETQETVLETLQEHFQLRKHKLLVSSQDDDNRCNGNGNGNDATVDGPRGSAAVGGADTGDSDDLLDANEWDNVEWSSFHMHRILSRNYRGEVFLGDYSGAQLEAMNHTTGNLLPFTASVSLSAESFAAFPTPSGDSFAQGWATKLHMMLDVCRGLAHAHDAGVTHGDLRSKNVLVTESFACKLNDFSHYARSDKYATTTLRLQSDASDDDDDDNSDNDNESDSDDADADVIDPEGVHLMEFADAPLRHAKKPVEVVSFARSHRSSCYSLPLLPPEVLHHAPRHVGSDIYSCGVLLIELWFYRFVSTGTVAPSLVDDTATGAIGGGGDTLLTSHAKLSTTLESQMDEQLRVTTDGIDMTSSLLSLDRSKAQAHNTMVQQFVAKLRASAFADMDEPTNDRSFGTTTTSSTASLTFASPAMRTEKLFAVVEECLHFDPKKRPTAKMLVKLFQQLLDDSSPRHR